MASRMDRTVHSMLLTTPLRRPRQGTLPTPRMVMPSASTSPTTAETFVVPRSSPTTISLEVREDFMIVQRLRLQSGMRGRDSGDAAMLACLGPNFGGWVSLFCGCFVHECWRLCTNLRAVRKRRSSHPHHDALGVRLVVEEDDPRSSAFFAQFADDFFGHQELLAPRAGAQLERHAVLAAGQGDVARVGQMHLFCRINAAQRHALE